MPARPRANLKVNLSVLVPPNFTRRGALRRALFHATCPPALNSVFALLKAWRRGLITIREHHMMNFFVVVGTQRTGTTVLRETLNSNPAVALSGEVFLRDPGGFDDYAAKVGWSRPEDYLAAERQILDFLKHLADSADASMKVFGIDVKYSHLRAVSPRHQPLSAAPALVQFIKLAGVRVIHVVRENVLQSALSEHIAEARAIWHHRCQESIGRTVKIDCRKLFELMQMKRGDRQMFTALMDGHSRMMTIEYDRISKGLAQRDAEGKLIGERNAIFEIAEFLGVDPCFHPPQGTTKIMQAPYASLIENYEELRRFLRRTEFAAYLETI